MIPRKNIVDWKLSPETRRICYGGGGGPSRCLITIMPEIGWFRGWLGGSTPGRDLVHSRARSFVQSSSP